MCALPLSLDFVSPQNEPSEILPHLYLGDVSHSAQRPLLEQLGITALLNVSSSCDNHFQTSYTYKNVTVSDDMGADLISWFPELIDFIDSVSSQQGRVLVHCRAGVSRSATVCIAYIMHKQGLSLDSAYEFVKSKRPVIDPNINFIQQLQKFETLLKARPKPRPPQARVKPPAPLLLRPPPCSLACSLQTNSAPLLASSSSLSSLLHNNQQQQQQRRPLSPQVFTFSPAKLPHHHQQTKATTSSSSSLPPCGESAHITQMDVCSPSPTKPSHFVYPSGHAVPAPPPPSVELSAGPEGRLSPCSLSQTAASPSPVCHPPAITVTRPGSLPLLQISSPISSSQQPPLLLPSPAQQPAASRQFRASPALRSRSPHFLFFSEGPEEGTEASVLNYPDIPSTPRDCKNFSFFGAGSPEPTGATTPEEVVHPAAGASPALSPLFGPELILPGAATLPRSPASPLGFPLSPLHSPLPSCS
ncbi:dual specificity protein phosphatase 1 [Plakobranchus ocellatus]|uniref:Dual specificity protein phosphatase 1 n=1 Tax=Plakobranchus ocellatus TaxID=259542 RepID=A0AAV4DQT1_9GAST|nr:dual specificity protein phosphatase 1 [Plakobranchus ocellatus]